MLGLSHHQWLPKSILLWPTCMWQKSYHNVRLLGTFLCHFISQQDLIKNLHAILWHQWVWINLTSHIWLVIFCIGQGRDTWFGGCSTKAAIDGHEGIVVTENPKCHNCVWWTTHTLQCTHETHTHTHVHASTNTHTHTRGKLSGILPAEELPV